MSGIIWAFIAAISFGLFQTINRKAGIQSVSTENRVNILRCSILIPLPTRLKP